MLNILSRRNIYVGFIKTRSLKTIEVQLSKLTDNNSFPLLKTQECAMKASEMASLSNFRWQNCKERLNRSTNNGDVADTAKRYVVCESPDMVNSPFRSINYRFQVGYYNRTLFTTVGHL